MRLAIPLIAASAAALVASPALAAAVINFPPPGSHAFVALYEIDSGLHVCPQVQCTIVSSPTQEATLNPVSFADNVGNFINGSGSTSGTTLRGFVSGRDAAELDVVFDDTYTVHGGAAPFLLTTTMTIDGVLSSIPVSPTLNFLLTGSFSGRIGQLNIDPAALIPTVDPFASATTGGITSVGASPFSQAASIVVSYSQMVNPGQVFDLAYELQAAFSIGSVDVSHTATIGFDTPDGVYLTSASGATFGDVPTTSVPEPAAWALMIVGFGLAGASLRRRRQPA